MKWNVLTDIIAVTS